jgi:hypothetical protein
MSRKRQLVSLGALAGLAGVATLVALLCDRPGVTHRNFQRIQIGMSFPEVEAAFGVPPNSVAPNGKDWSMLLFDLR